MQAPADMSVGKKWKSAYQTLRPDGVTENSFWEYQVKGYDTVTVPAGTFRAYYVVGRGEARSPTDITYLEHKSWFDPATLRRVRLERIFRNGGKITENSIFELVSFKPGGS